MQSILAVILPTSTFWPTMTEEHRWWMVGARHTMVTPCDNYCDDFCHNSCDNWDRQDGQLQVASDPCVTIPHWQICLLSTSRLDETIPVLLFLCPGNDCRVWWLQHCFIRCNGRKNKTGLGQSSLRSGVERWQGLLLDLWGFGRYPATQFWQLESGRGWWPDWANLIWMKLFPSALSGLLIWIQDCCWYLFGGTSFLWSWLNNKYCPI